MKHLDSLIRGEMSAVKSIDGILERIKDPTEKNELTSLRKDHVDAVDKLKRFAGSEFKEEVTSSGPWGSFAKAFTQGASLFGDKAALQALKVGEEHGRNEYQEALASGTVSGEVRDVIQNELLPNQEKHLELINRYLQ